MLPGSTSRDSDSVGPVRNQNYNSNKCPVILMILIQKPMSIRIDEWNICISEYTWWIRKSEVGSVLMFFSSVQLLSRVRLLAAPWTAARQASLSITNSWSLPKLMSIELVMPSNHLILRRPLLLLPSIFPSIRVFSNESALRHQVVKVLEF